MKQNYAIIFYMSAIMAAPALTVGAEPATASDATFEIPFTLAPTQADINRMTIIDVAEDGRTWSYEDKEKALFYRYSTKLDADDYAVIPINVTETDKLFRFSVSARCQNGYFGESFELCAGGAPTPEALTPIYRSGMIYNEDYRPFEAYFAAAAPGTYYVALHMVSPKNCMRFYVRDIAVEQTESSRFVPAQCSDPAVTAAPAGALSATVTFNAPANHADGTPLDPSQQLTIKVVSAAATKTLTAMPGESVSTDIATIHGNNTIELIPSNNQGEGLHASLSIFTGPDIPDKPEVTATVNADNMSMKLKFNVSPVGKNGGYVDPAAVSYSFHSYVEENGVGSWTRVQDIGVCTEYDYTLPEGTPQNVVNLGITASNASGENTSVVAVSEVLGTPHKIPANETFAGHGFTYIPVVIEAPTDEYGAEYTIIDPVDLLEDAANRSKLAMAGFITDYGATKGQIALPRFSTMGVTSAKIGLHVYFHELMPETSVELSGFGQEPVTVGTFNASTHERGWHTVQFDIPQEMLDRDWIAPTITSSYPGEEEEEYIIIDKYFLRPDVAHDVAVEAIYGDKKLTVTEPAEFTAVIENRGTQSASLTNAVFRLLCGDTTLETRPVDEMDLAPGQTAEATFDFTPTADHIGTLSLSLTIETPDDDPSNNTASATFAVEKGENHIITDLEGNCSDGHVNLQWTGLGKLAGFQNMEKLSAFYYGSRLGEFTNKDLDGKNTFVISGFSFPGNGYAKAFQVFNYPKSNVATSNYLPYSGDQYLIAFAPDDEITPADDWLISPKVAPGTEISFMFNIISSKYSPEKIEILISSTDNAPESFTSLRTVSKSSQGWEKITETLPDGARYFALRYISCNTFGILIDDIDYIPEGGLPEVTYNVYRNASLIKENLTEPAYCDIDAPEGTNRYNVAAVINGVEQPLSNSAIISTSILTDINGSSSPVYVRAEYGSILIGNLSGEPVSIYSIDGRTIAFFTGIEGSVSKPVAPGIYIVHCGSVSTKVMVRG